MPNTPNLALPYPVPADTVDVPRDVLALATRLDVSPAGLVAALPGAPVDGQTIAYQNAAMAAAGAVWRLCYRAASPSAYKWEFIGGDALFDEVGAGVAPSVGSWVDTAGGPTLTAPLAGDYVVRFGALALPPQTAAAAVNSGFRVAAGGPSQVLVLDYPAGHVSLAAETRRTAVAAGSAFVAQALASHVGAQLSARYMALTPIRVG